MKDIVLDTCTLVHANNSKSGYQQDSIELINLLLNNKTLVTVDEGFELDETTNQSYIALEYMKHLTPGMLGYSLITTLALTQRFNFVENNIPQATKNYIEQLIRNKKDRMFLRVTFNSSEKVLVSHDYTDYQIKKRKKILKDIEIDIVEAEDVNPIL